MWHLATLASGPLKQCRYIQHPVATTFFGAACPGPSVTHPRCRGLENARVGLLFFIYSCESIFVRVINAQDRSTIEREARELKTHTNTESTESTNNPNKAERGERPKRKGRKQTQTGQRTPNQEHRHSHCVLLTSQLHLLKKRKQVRQSPASCMSPMSYRSAMRIVYTLLVEAFSLTVTAAWNPPRSPG